MNVSRRKELFPEVTDAQWNDWKWQVKNRIETLDELKKYVKLTPEEEEGVKKCRMAAEECLRIENSATWLTASRKIR